VVPLLLCGLDDGDLVSESFELADVVAGFACFVDPVLVVAGAEVGVPGAGFVEEVPDDDKDGAGDGDLGFGGTAAAGDAGVPLAEVPRVPPARQPVMLTTNPGGAVRLLDDLP
jgi:hypothetical protein